MTAPATTAPRPEDPSRLGDGDRRTRLLADALPVGLYVIDASTRVVQANRAFCELMGLTHEEVVGATAPFPFWPEADHAELCASLAAITDGRLTVSRERFYQRSDGSLLPVRCEICCIDDWPPDTGPVVLVTVHDMSGHRTEVHRLQEACRLARVSGWDYYPATDLLVHPAGLTGFTDIASGGATLGAVLKAVAPASRERFRSAIRALVAGLAQLLTIEVELAQPQAGVTWIELCMRAVRNTESSPVHRISGAPRDITASKQAQLRLERSEQQLSEAQRLARIGSLEIDHRRGELRETDGLRAIIGQPAKQLWPGIAATDPGSAGGRPDPITEAVHATRADGEVRRVEDVLTVGGEVRDVECRVEPLVNRGERTGVRLVVQDVSDLRLREQQLESARGHLRALTDAIGEGLVGLDEDGRLLYMNRVAEEMLGWTASEVIGSVLHDVARHRRADGTPLPADECSLIAAARENRIVRASDELLTHKDGSDLPVSLTASPFQTEDGLHGSVVVFRDNSARHREEERWRAQMEQLSWAGRIRDALSQSRFTLYAQPIVDLRTGRTVQHELLLRMVEPDGTVVLPGSFLPAAEQYELILDIDRWVVAEAVDVAAAGIPVEFNLSAHALTTRGVIEEFHGRLESTGADPSLIVIELTETALIGDALAAQQFISRVKQLGCSVAMDDFGTGYGGFSYLKALSVDFLKIDREFVRDICTNEGSRHVVKAVINLAQGFGQRTIAEGIEDAETLDMLTDLGVDLAQGYLFARPAPLPVPLSPRGEVVPLNAISRAVIPDPLRRTG